MNNSKKQNPIVLVHGIFDTKKMFRKMESYLSSLGRTALSIDLIPNNGKAPHEEMASQLKTFINSNFPDTKIDLVGFSMGGIVSRYYIQKLGGHEKVEKLITISAPHHGTIMAWFSKRPVALQLRPKSDFLRDLNENTQALEKIEFISFWTPLDLVIVPPASSQMSIAKNIRVIAPWHDQMVRLPNALKAVGKALS